MTGQTCTSRKGYKTRYYVCGRHSSSHKHECPKWYTFPAEAVENHILDLIRNDLSKLRDDDQLQRSIAAELKRITGGRYDACEQLQRQLAGLDQQLAKVRDHLLAMDVETARSLGFYDQARELADEKAAVEQRLEALPGSAVVLPEPGVIRRRASAEFDRLGEVIAGGTLEEKRELIGLYVHEIKADPDRLSVHIGLYPTLLSQKIAGDRYLPDQYVQDALWALMKAA